MSEGFTALAVVIGFFLFIGEPSVHDLVIEKLKQNQCAQIEIKQEGE